MCIRSFAVVSLLILLAGAGQPAAEAPVSVPTDEQAVQHALNRLTFGSRPGDVERVRSIGLQNWIEQQLAPAGIDDRALAARLDRLETLKLDSKTIQQAYSEPAMVERRRRQLENPTPQPQDPASTPNAPGPKRSESFGRVPNGSDIQRKDRQVIADIEEAKLLRAVYSERQLDEVLVDFWFNHFNVFAGKGATRNYLGEYERAAIRPYVLGNFRELLGATAKSPAMLFYLDNWMNTSSEVPGAKATPRRGAAPTPTMAGGPSPTSGASPRRSRGINENYARELMELHTLGVDGAPHRAQAGEPLCQRCSSPGHRESRGRAIHRDQGRPSRGGSHHHHVTGVLRARGVSRQGQDAARVCGKRAPCDRRRDA